MSVETVSGGQPEQPGSVSYSDDKQMVRRGFVCARELTKKIRSSAMYHVQEITDATKNYPGFCGDNRHLAVGAPDSTIRLFYVFDQENEKRTSQNIWDDSIDSKGDPGEKYDNQQSSYQQDISKQANEDTKKNKDDNYNKDKFMRGPGDVTKDRGVFTNQCQGEVGSGMAKKLGDEDRGDPKLSASTTSPQPEQLPQGIDTNRMPGSPTDAWEQSFIYLGGNPSPTDHTSVGGIRTNCAWPLVNTMPPASVEQWRVDKGRFFKKMNNGLQLVSEVRIDEDGYYCIYPFVWGTSHAYHEPYWRPDMWETPLINYFPPGDRSQGTDNKKGSNRVSWDMMTDHVSRDAEILEDSNKKLWTTGGIHHTGGIRPKHGYGELTLASSIRGAHRKHLRSTDISFNSGETSHFQQPPENYRQDEDQFHQKMKKKVKERMKKEYEKDLPKIREAERNKFGE